MKTINIFTIAMVLGGISTFAIADEITQVTMPNGSVTTTVQSPEGTTQISTTAGQSTMSKLKDGTRIEMDSDGSVYKVYPDGARVAAPNGMNTLITGETITVKDGKRIP